MLGNYLQQMTSADDVIRCIFFLGALRVYTGSTKKVRKTCCHDCKIVDWDVMNQHKQIGHPE